MDRPFGGATIQSDPFGRASPILIFGIVVFVIPMLGGIFGWHIPLKSFISGVGIVMIILGVIHSAFKD